MAIDTRMPAPPAATVRPMRLLTISASVGIGVELTLHNTLLHGAPPGVGFTLAGTAAAAAIITGRTWLGTAPSRSATLLAGLAALFSIFVVWRAAPELAVANAMATVGLLVGAAYLYGGRSLTDLTLPEYPMAGYRTVTGSLAGPIRFAPRVAPAVTSIVPRLSGARPVLRGLAIAVVPLALFAALFASADAVFADFLGRPLSVDLSLGGFATGVVFAAVFSWITLGGLWHAVTHDDYPEWDPHVERPSLGRAEAVTLLGAIDVLFLGFVMVQFAYLFGGRATVADTGGLTYAEYAREGFFQLLVVAALAIGVILAVDYLVNHSHTRSRLVDGLHLLLVVLTGVVLASAVARLDGYMDEFGLSKLRLYAFAALVWIAFVLAWTAATVIRGRRSRFPAGAFLAGLVVLAALNVANPDARIASVNLDRQLDGGRELDIGYATASLSADAVPVLIDGLAALPSCDRAALNLALLANADTTGGGWRSFNLGRQRADRLIGDLERLPAAGC